MGTWDDRVRERVKALLKKHPRELTQDEIAAATDWQQPNVSAYLKGRVGADLDRLALFAKLCGVRLADLFTDAEPVGDELQALAATVDAQIREAALTLLRAAQPLKLATPPRRPASRGTHARS